MLDQREPRYFPAWCLAGHPPYLTEAKSSADALDDLRCPLCGGEGRLMPGAYYTSRTRERFESVVACFPKSDARAPECSALIAELEHKADLHDPQALRAIFAHSGPFAALGALVPRERHELPAFVGLVVQLLGVPPSSSVLPSAAEQEEDHDPGQRHVQPDRQKHAVQAAVTPE